MCGPGVYGLVGAMSHGGDHYHDEAEDREHSSSQRLDVLRPRRTGKHFELRLVSGEVLVESRWDRMCRRIYEDTTMGWLCEHVPSVVRWPSTRVRLVAAEQVFSHRQLIRERSKTLLSSLAGNDQMLMITVIKLNVPDSLSEFPSLCLCDFVGCCIDGGHHCTHGLLGPGAECQTCGQDACCRCGDCGHSCCEQAQRRTRSRSHSR